MGGGGGGGQKQQGESVTARLTEQPIHGPVLLSIRRVYILLSFYTYTSFDVMGGSFAEAPGPGE